MYSVSQLCEDGGDKQIWLRGTWGDKVTISPSPSLPQSFATVEMQSVWCDGLGPRAAKPTQTHFITPSPSPSAPLSNQPESFWMWHAANITSRATLQKAYGCSSMAATMDTDARTHSNDTRYITFPQRGTHTQIGPQTNPAPQQPSKLKALLIHSCSEWKKALVPTIMPRMIHKKIQHAEREERQCADTKQPLQPHFPFLYFLQAKGPFTPTKTVNVRFFFLPERQIPRRLKKVNQHCVSFLDAQPFHSMMA